MATATLEPVTTAPDGTFTLTDTPPVAGTFGYTPLWDGSAAYRWSSASTSVAVAKYPSVLTLSGPPPGTAGKPPLHFTGTAGVGGEVLPPFTYLTVRRTVTNKSGTVTTALDPIGPAADGSFSFSDRPTQGGQYTYTVR